MKNGLIAYTDRDQSGHQNIFLINENGSGKRQITGGSNDHGLPDWSPNGQQILFTIHESQTGRNLIGIMNHDGNDPYPIIDGTAPCWSPNGERIAYTKNNKIAIMTSNGNPIDIISKPDWFLFHPTWGQNDQLACAAWSPKYNRGGIVKLSYFGNSFITDLTLNGSAPLNNDQNGNFLNTAFDSNSPSWRGDLIAFWSGVENGLGQIWTMNSDGSNRRQLTFGDRNDDPAFSPDGAKILFSTDRSGHPELWVMNTDGSNQHKITNNSAGPLPGDASWQPL